MFFHVFIPTVLNLSLVSSSWKSEQLKKAIIKKKTKKVQKWQLGLEVGGLQCKTPYHVLKLSSTDWKKGKKVLLQSKSQFVGAEKKSAQSKIGPKVLSEDSLISSRWGVEKKTRLLLLVFEC